MRLNPEGEDMRARLLVGIAALALGVSTLGASPTSAAGNGDHTESLATFHASFKVHKSVSAPHGGGLHGGRRPGSTPGIDTVLTYSGGFTSSAPSPDYSGTPTSQWYYQFAGREPAKGGTTTFHAPVMPVVVNLLDTDGSVAWTEDPSGVVSPTLGSPIFTKTAFSSSDRSTQFGDAVMRANFYRSAPSNWHTMLSPTVIPTRTINIPSGSWEAVVDGSGHLAAALVEADTFANAVFPVTGDDTSTPIGAAEHAGQMSTKDITTLLFRNVFLYYGDPGACCTLGFHTYDYENGTPQNGNLPRAYVMNYSSWVDPGLFSPDAPFDDSGVLGHEMAETLNDPLVATDPVPGASVTYDETPWWQAPFGLCQANLEVGDVTEGLSTGAGTTVTTPAGTYHVPNVALLPWFASGDAPQSYHNQYSYPQRTLTAPSVPQNAGCQ
jgi:hypothetical protein